jgi:hypothetical protein
MNTFLRFNYSARITMLVYELAASLYVLCRIYYYIAIKNHLVYWRRQDLTCWFHESKRSLTSRIVGERLFSDDALIFEVDVWRTRKPCKTSIKSYSRNLYHSSQEWYIYSVNLYLLGGSRISKISCQHLHAILPQATPAVKRVNSYMLYRYFILWSNFPLS